MSSTPIIGRLSLLVCLALPCFVGQTLAQSVQPSRFTLERSGDDFVRLDEETGTISLCNERGGQMVCRPSVDAIAAFEAEIDKLEQENRRLRKELTKLKKTLGNAIKDIEKIEERSTTKSVKTSEPWIGPAEKEKLGEAMDFAEDAMRRFYGMVDQLKKDLEGEPQK